MEKIYLAYDGSINGDWVAQYAIQMARVLSHPGITLVHILDGAYSSEKINAKISAIRDVCQANEVAFVSDVHSLDKNVCHTLLQVIPEGSSSLCICGARLHSRGKGFLAGTISDRLLRRRKFNVFAIRVVQPGLLGMPSDLLFPLAGHPCGFESALPFFLLLAPGVDRLHILRVMRVHPFLFRYLSPAKARIMRQHGIVYANRILEEIHQEIGESNIQTDARVVVSDDWVKEVLIHASKLKARLILIGASDRYLRSRFYYGNQLEQILRETPCDVGIYRKV